MPTALQKEFNSKLEGDLSILSVPDDGYSRVICTKFETYVFISAL
jgi:hypothetical protein